MFERLEATLRPLDIPFEVVAVDDGSSDSTRRVFDEVRRRPNYIVRDVLRPSAQAAPESEPVSLQTRRGR